MSGYTSGRPVKSSKAQPTTIATATADARRLINRNLPMWANATAQSSRCADVDLTVRIKTEITFRDGVDTDKLVAAILELPRYHSVAVGTSWISYLRNI